MNRLLILCLLVSLWACSPQPNPEQQATLQKQTKAADAAEARVKALEAERSALLEELERERQQHALLEKEIRHVEGVKP